MLPIPAGFTMRALTMDDAPAVAQLIIECDIAESGTPDYSLEDLLQEWQLPGFDLAKDSWLVTAPKGEIVGYAAIWIIKEGEIQTVGNTLPDYQGRGIGSYLLALIEERVLEQLHQNRFINQYLLDGWANGANQAAINLLQEHGYNPARYIWRMQIELNAPPEVAHWPEGVTVRSFIPEQDALNTYEVYEAAFAEHWGHIQRPFEEWQQRRLTGINSDLWFLAEAAGQIAGISLGKHQSGMAEINTLGVIADWRGKGVGIALLQYSFSEFYRRGHRVARLGVDSQNATGATRLYQRAGMSIERQYNLYQKKIRG